MTSLDLTLQNNITAVRRLILSVVTTFSIIFSITTYNSGIGIGTTIAVIASVLVILATHIYRYKRVNPSLLVTLGASVVLSVFFILRASPLLHFLNSVTIAFLFLFAIKSSVNGKLGVVWWNRYFFSWVETPIRSFIRSIEHIPQLKSVGSHTSSKLVISILVGIIISFPFAGIFIALFSSVDSNFATFIASFISFQNVLHIIGYIFCAVIGLIVSALVTLYLLFATQEDRDETYILPEYTARSFISPMVTTVLASISVICIAFIAFQAEYLFGGAELISNTNTYAQYATSGFFQITIAVVLAIALIRGLKWVVQDQRQKTGIGFWVVSTMLSIVLVPISFSAVSRTLLYIETYGLTIIRLFALVWMVLLGVVSILLTVQTMLQSTKPWYSQTTVSLAVLTLVGMNILNPDAFVAQSYITDYKRGEFIDLYALSDLSIDAHKQWEEIAQSKKSEFRVREVERYVVDGVIEKAIVGYDEFGNEIVSENTVYTTTETQYEHDYFMCQVWHKNTKAHKEIKTVANFSIPRFQFAQKKYSEKYGPEEASMQDYWAPCSSTGLQKFEVCNVDTATETECKKRS